jgi:hypothetical protein
MASELRLCTSQELKEVNMQSDHFIEVMALLNAIVRCFNDNIKKIDMNRLAQPLFVGQVIPAVTMSTVEAEKA